MGPAPLRVVRRGRPMHAWLGTAPCRRAAPWWSSHGANASSRTMLPLLRGNLARARARPGPAGHGRSRAPAACGLHQADAQADALIDWLDALEVEHAAFVGNSYGCQVIASFAARHPERTSCVVP
ncbi:MAG: alpha/beta fold hydrolase [Planctomycetota bacterium]|nr:alpha/beta fold hydrolase [Planctomycetota bacterium]